MSNDGFKYVLGIDMGANSVGWALFSCERQKNSPPEIIDLTDSGVRIFEEGVENFNTLKEESRGTKRTHERGHRRQLERRAQRTSNLFSILQHARLLPTDGKNIFLSDKEWDKLNWPDKNELRREQRASRDGILAKLDRDIFKKWKTKDGDNKAGKKLPYLLRAAALDKKLTEYELGRALYHLGQRRGFKSNRKSENKKGEKTGPVKQKIKELTGDIESSDYRTLGEYFASLDPEEKRIRNKKTARQMYEDEFNLIWEKQKEYHKDILTDELRQKIKDTVFIQRPLKSQKDRIGDCELEPKITVKNPKYSKTGNKRNRKEYLTIGKKRAPKAILLFQRFRIIQQLLNLKVTGRYIDTRFLTQEEVKILKKALDTKKELTYVKARKLLGLKQNCSFTIEDEVNKKLIGNSTAAKIKTVFKKRWDTLSEEDREKIVEDLLSIQNHEALARCAQKVWGLSKEEAEKFSNIQLEDRYCNLSRQALKNILPEMEKGLKYMEAVTKIYGTDNEKPKDFLPPVEEFDKYLANPSVKRTLSELRKVINAIIREYGKPELIRIELARDLKNTRQQRKNIIFKNAKNKKGRDEAKEWLEENLRMTNPSNHFKEKYILWEECRRTCPYTGDIISKEALFGLNPKFDIEHIIPRSRSLDNTFFNKTLCKNEENIGKGNKTPYEFYGGNEEEYQRILDHVDNFACPEHVKRAKLDRFKMKEKDLEEMLSNFTERQLQDTRYASKLAAKYLSLLYGASEEKEVKQHIQTSAGQVTAMVRGALNLNSILNDGGKKERKDHRHHAVDAVAIGLISPGLVKKLSNATKSVPLDKKTKFYPDIPEPWPGFLEDVRKLINDIKVSHRVNKKVRGALHKDTNYAKKRDQKTGEEFYSVRKELKDVTKVEKIVDDKIKKIVKKKIEELGGGTPGTLFKNSKNHPKLETKNGDFIDIHKVRVKEAVSPLEISDGNKKKFVTTKNNHHMEIFEYKDKKGKVKWNGDIIPLFEAVQRKNNKQQIIKKDHGPDKKFLFSLAFGEIIEIDNNGKRELFRIRTISNEGSGRFAIVKITDSRKQNDIKRAKKWRRPFVDALRELNTKKVTIDPLGNVRDAND
jgi:CRISPR-associated endonuclease Csn1